MSDEYLLPQMMSRSTPEDILTEALAYVLRNSAPFRRLVAERVWGRGNSGADDDFEIETQQEAGGGRADVMWKSPGRTFILESKIWAWWGQEQPGRYIHYLRDLVGKGGDAVFGLVAPSTRLAALRDDAVRRLRKDFPATSWNDDSGEAGKVRLVCFSWRDVGDWLRETSGEEDDPRTKTHMEEVIVVTDQIDPRFKSKPERLAVDGLGAALWDLCRIVANVRDKLESDGVEVRGISSGDDKGWYYGFYLKPPASPDQVWFGIWIGPWASKGEGPLWLTAYKRKAVCWLRSRVRDTMDYGESCIIPVRLEGNTWDEVRERVVVRLNSIINENQEANNA